MMSMPILPVNAMVSGLSDRDAGIVRAAFTTRGVNKDTVLQGGAKLRANKPHRRVGSFEEGCANYVWRMLCFDLVGSGKHACMPVCADFELSEALELRYGRIRYGQPGYDEQKERSKTLRDEMDALVSRVEKGLPPEALKGIIRWGRALGMIG
jgi:hypothetical protein